MRTRIIVLSVLFAAGITAEPKIIDRAAEEKKYPDLQETEKQHDRNIQDAYSRMNAYAPLVAMTAKDRATAFREKVEPMRFEHTFRFVTYTPRNTYIRYVKETPEMLYAGLGDVKTIQELVAAKTKQANDAVIPGGPIATFTPQNRDGVELTQFNFVLRQDADRERAIGSRRKSVMLFYKAGGTAAPDTEGAQELDMVVTRIVEDDYDAGVKNVEVIIDPSPSTPGTNDVVTLHRYNLKVTTCALVATMSNTPNYPHRADFKRKFYTRLLDHFDTLYRMVDTYAKRDGNDVNDKTITRMRDGMDY
jgi:hypothetical protein